MIGATLIAEGFDIHIEKGFIYGPIAFAIVVEALNLTYKSRQDKRNHTEEEPVHLRQAIVEDPERITTPRHRFGSAGQQSKIRLRGLGKARVTIVGGGLTGLESRTRRTRPYSSWSVEDRKCSLRFGGWHATGMVTNFPDQDPAGSPPNAVEEQLLAVGKAWAEAIVANDAARIATFVTDDWVIVSESGISAGTNLLTLVASGDLTHSAMEVVGQPRISILGATATVTARITNTAHYQGRRFDADEWTTDVYVRRDDRWLCALTHYTSATPSP